MVRVSFHNFSKIGLISDNVASWAENLILVQLTAVPQCRSAAVRLKNNHYQLARNEFGLESSARTKALKWSKICSGTLSQKAKENCQRKFSISENLHCFSLKDHFTRKDF